MPKKKVARAEAERVIQRWNDHLALGRDRGYTMARRVRCATSTAIDLRTIDRLCRHSGARPEVLMVPGLGADAKADRLGPAAAVDAADAAAL